jgi:hypothetical protein
MSLTLEEITQLPDPTTVLDDIDQYTATQFIRALRRSWALDPHKRVSYRLAENLHRRHPDDIVVTTVFTAVLKDVGELDRAANLLADRLRDDCDWFFLRVVGSVLWRKRLRTSAQFAFELAQHFEDAGKGNFQITPETLATLRDRLRGTWLPNDVFFEFAEEGNAVELTSEELTALESPVAVPGLDGITIRPLKSKRQLARVANQLKNCLNSYLSQVLNGTTLLFAVELNGAPIEAIEVNPASRKVVQWKGVANSKPNTKIQPHIRKALISLSLSSDGKPFVKQLKN